MRRIVVADIFGRTPALEKLCQAIASDVDILDPYSGKYMDFRNEQEAYSFFMANVGLQAYGGLLFSRLKNNPAPLGLVGFSVGAAAVWKISGSMTSGNVKRVVCFYGSQIRHMTAVRPGVAVEHVLPAHEPGFSIDELASRLAGTKNVVLHRTPYRHGFMNELSKNFSPSGYARYIDWLRGNDA